MSTTVRPPLPLYLLACLFSLLALFSLWYSLGRPVKLADAASPTHKLQCVSYTPFDKDQSPYDQPLQLRPARIDADLALLAKRFQCIRTYSMTGLEGVPALARKHGLKVMLGAWVNANPKDTAHEVQALIDAANANPDVVTSVIVGNEVLLRKEITGGQLVKLIAQVKAAIKQPVTYADVWEFWEQYPEVAPAVDFLTIHLLPYWEDNPKGIDQALAHVARIRQDFGERFAPKDILIGETGWPSEGRQRETARPSRVNEAKFLRNFVFMAEQRGWHYNLIEAFDQPWKRANEGAMGGHWGIYDADRQDKGILAGRVSNLPSWPRWLALSAALFFVGLYLAGPSPRARSTLGVPLLAAFGAGSIGLWAHQSWVDSRFIEEWLWAGLIGLLNLVVLAHATLAMAKPSGWRQHWFNWLEARARFWLTASGFVGAVLMLAMVFEPRYRSFPYPAIMLPALVYLVRPVAARRGEVTLLLAIVALGIPVQLYLEGLRNPQAWAWAAASAVMAAALVRASRTR
ncbi:glycosyl hydrolase family 17 protein [Pseudomonas sp. nanlin1]|uniref:glycoside hydrolase family 17 protein n=1 Tax=Pseudomonas sp. nanlin1 TaxID=3040605 RepID=UPI00388CEEEB